MAGPVINWRKTADLLMAAEVIIRKYTGKDGSFGTHVSSLGIKRVDTCVPAVYSSERLGGKVIPADDGSEAAYYCVYGEEDRKCTAYSMECVFKIHLEKAPDVQLSNIRIYPAGDPPSDGKVHPILRIGNSVGYTKPTNAKSVKAVHDIWEFSKEHPFYLTVAGLYGQVPDPSLGITEYTVEYKDYGYGNVIALNGTRQLAVPVATKADPGSEIEVRFINRSFNQLAASNGHANFIEFVALNEDGTVGEILGEPYVTVRRTEAGDMVTIRVKTDEFNLMEKFPYGLVYRIPKYDGKDHPNSGYVIYWVNLYNNSSRGFGQPAYIPSRWFVQNRDPLTHAITETSIPRPGERPVVHFDVIAKDEGCGQFVYYLNGSRAPQLVLDPGYIYHFKNTSGKEFPLRFVGNVNSPMASDIEDVIVDGVVVLNGGTEDEEITVDPEAVIKASKMVGAYQCVCAPYMGNVVYNHPMFMCGQYNMCRVGGGIYNPLMAGETDYVYMQLEVPGDSEPGYAVPQLHIEYDEN